MAKTVKPGKLRGNTYPNAVTPDPDDYTLSIIGGMSYSLRDLAQLVVKSGITTQSEDQLVGDFRLIMEKGIEMGLQGNNISLDYITMRFGVKGVFNSANEIFSRPKHEVTAILGVGQVVRDAMRETLVENLGPGQNLAQMDTFINKGNGEVNLRVTAGQVLEIKGVNLKVGGDHPNVGVFLQEEPSEGKQAIKVSVILVNEPKHLMFMVPDSLVEGRNYRVTIVSQQGASSSAKSLKEPRSSVSDRLLKCKLKGGDSESPGEI